VSKTINILSTKKLLPHQKEAFLNTNIQLIEDDFIEIIPAEFEINIINDTILVSSQNAVLSLLSNPKIEELKKLPVFCVGFKTKDLLEENGFTVEVYTGYAADLAEIITLIYSNRKFTFFSGNLRRDTLPEALKINNIIFNEIQVYQTQLTPKKITQPLDGIIFFSPSGVESYSKLNTIKKETCFCIGTTTAEALNPKNDIVIAENPVIEMVIAKVLEKYNC
jgi:uroporphyrinogen-III synthase